jgi:hypothetical protein
MGLVSAMFIEFDEHKFISCIFVGFVTQCLVSDRLHDVTLFIIT